MLEVLLQILIIIGYLLLFLLGIAVVLLLIVLYYPVSYRFYLEKEAEKTEYQFCFRWLFGLLKGRYMYPEPKVFQLFLFGRPWEPMGSKNKEESKTSKNKKTPQSVKKNVAKEERVMDKKESVSSESTSEEAPSEEKKSILDKMKSRGRGILDKIISIRDTICYYYEIVKDESTHALITMVFGEIINVVRYLKPKKKSADLLVGTGSPDTTGYLCGVYGMFAAALGPKFVFTPDFTRKVFEGTLDFRGNTNIFVLIMVVLRIYKNKDFSTFMQKIKKNKTAA